MRQPVSWLFTYCLLLVTSASAEVNVPVDDKAALEFYKNSQLVISKATVNPFELAGCLVFHKDGQVDQYFNILPESIKKTLKPQNLTESVYRTMLTKDQAVKVGFLGMLGISTSEKSLLEVAINDRWKMEGPSIFSDGELKKNALEVGKIYASLGYKVSYNQNVKYSTLVTSDYQESAGDIKSAFTYIDGAGKRFVQSSNYAQKELIAIAPFDITPFLATWDSKTVSAASVNFTQSQIESLTTGVDAYTDKVIKLNSVDITDLRVNSKRLTSKELKERLFK